MPTFAQRVLDAAGPAFIDRAGPLVVPLVEGLTDEVAATDTLLSPTGAEGWAVAFDLDETPYPGWLGQSVGTRVLGGLTAAEAREFVRTRKAWRRGTPSAILAAVTATLVGSQRADLLERDSSPWHLTIQVYASEVPGGDIGPVLAAAASQKPVGIIMAVSMLTGATYAHMTAEHGPTYTDEQAVFPTYADARDHLPEV